MLARVQSAAQQSASATIGHAKQKLLACLTSRLNHAEDPEITVADEQALGGGTENNMAGQDLLAEVNGAQGAIQGGPTQGADANDHAHQTPIRLAVLVAISAELLGDGSVRPQPDGAAIQQGDDSTVPENGGAQGDDLGGLQAQGLGQKLPRQALTSIAIGAGRVRHQALGELFVQAIGSAAASIGQGRVEGVVGIQALKEQIPKGDQGAKKALVEILGLEGGQLQPGGARQQLDKETQELGGSEQGRSGSGSWRAAVFFGIVVVCIYYSMHTLT